MSNDYSKIRAHNSNLPKSFFGFLPLYIGVETVLGITILNKCSGAYGLLALFTGHPLTFVQWISYMWSIFTLVVYAQGLYQIHKPAVLTFCHICITFSVDTLITCLFTVVFTAEWFREAEEVSKPAKDPYGQGASESAEYFFTMLITIASLASRFYFNLILLAFTQQLLLHPKYMIDQDDVEQDLKNKWKIKQWWIRSKKSCYNICRHILA